MNFVKLADQALDNLDMASNALGDNASQRADTQAKPKSQRDNTKAQAKSQCDTKTKLKKLLWLADAFIISAWEVHSSKEDREEQPLKGKPMQADEDLAKLLDNYKSVPRKDEIYWRALSLAAVRKAMALDGDAVKGCPNESSAAEHLISDVVDSSNAYPGIAYLHANVGIVKLRYGRCKGSSHPLQDALEQYQEAVRINDGDPWLRCLLAHAYEENGDIEEAERQVQFGHLLDPKHWNDYDTAVHRVWPVLMQ